MFSLTRLPVTQQMFLLFHKDYFIFFCRVMFRNPQERAVTTTQTYIPNNIYNVHRNMSNVFYNQSSGCFLKYIIDNISTGTVSFSIGEGETMAAPLCCASKTLRTHYPLTQCYLSRSFFQNKSLKLSKDC